MNAKFLAAAVCAVAFAAQPAVAAENIFGETTQVAAASTNATTEASSVGRMDVQAARSAPVYNWTGFYVGINGGYGLGNTDWEFSNAAQNHHTNNGFMVGGHFGYNYQFMNDVVVGAELSIAFADVNGNSPCPNTSFRCWSRMDVVGDATGRLGYAAGEMGWGNFMPFIRAGFTAAATEEFALHQTTPASHEYSHANTRYGYLLGAGAEWDLCDNLSLAAEYNYRDYGVDPVTTHNQAGGGSHVRARSDIHAGRLSVNYRVW